MGETADLLDDYGFELGLGRFATSDRIRIPISDGAIMSSLSMSKSVNACGKSSGMEIEKLGLGRDFESWAWIWASGIWLHRLR
ncbi:hypothetical protein ACFX2I_030031 [Malus domestica]